MSSNIPSLRDQCAAKACATYKQDEIEKMTVLTLDVKQFIKTYRETKFERCDIALSYVCAFEKKPTRFLWGIMRNTTCEQLKLLAIKTLKIQCGDEKPLKGFPSFNLRVWVNDKSMTLKETLADCGIKDGECETARLLRSHNPCAVCNPDYKLTNECIH